MASVPGTHTMIDYRGPISFETIETLLNQLRASGEFNSMSKPARKRLYGTFVESIDNIRKYAAASREPGNGLPEPFISVKKVDSHYLITTGNLVMNEEMEDLKFKLERINQLDKEALKNLYEEIINEESDREDKGAGLGLITMALRTEHEVRYRFHPVDDDHSYIEIQITINE